jgi:hypothetical protein
MLLDTIVVMDQTYSLLWLAFLLLFAGGGILLLLLSRFRRARPTPRLPYVAIPILTDSERRFFAVLEGCIPRHCYILAQVRLANLVAVESGTAAFRAHFNRVAMKCVDFVLVNHSTMVPLLVVELDDRSHDRADRQERDKFVDQVLTSIGLPILHWPVESRYNPIQLCRVIEQRIKK